MVLANNHDFRSWVSELKNKIRSAQIKAAVKVNTEMLRLYWRMGLIFVKSKKWHLGEMNIRQWFRFYGERITFGQQPVAQISEELFFSVPWEHHLYIIAQCKDIDKAINNVMAQYALEATNQPIGISEYQLSKLMP